MARNSEKGLQPLQGRDENEKQRTADEKCGCASPTKLNLNIKPIKVRIKKHGVKFPIDGMF